MSEAWTHWPAPAKLNLFLHVVGRRADGYHLLQTVFQLLDFGDSVALRVRGDGAIVRSAGIAGIADADDLTIRAARALQQYCGNALGADIRVDKRIPIGGGLGGGSSDAATTLVALNALWNAGLTTEALAGIGASLGADVAVFVRGHSAWAEGIGERLTPLELPARHYVIVDPRVGVPTGALFQAAELTRNSPPITITDYLAGKPTANVFAPLACARYAPVAAAMQWLRPFGEPRLSGSGGCAFVDVATAAEAAAIAAACPPAFAAFCAGGVARSALLDAVAGWQARQRRPQGTATAPT